PAAARSEGRPAPARRAAVTRRGSAARVALLAGEVWAELPAYVADQLLVAVGEVIALPARKRLAFEEQHQVAHLGRALAADALGGGVIPAVVVERILDRRRPEQCRDLLAAHARLELADAVR